MKKILIIFCFSALVVGCKKQNNERPVTIPTYDFRVYISDIRVTEISHILADTIISSTKYFFSDSLITQIDYYPGSIESNRTIFKLGANGFAESSYSIPEQYYTYGGDTFFTSLAHYTYDNQNRLIKKEYEVHHNNQIIMQPAYSYHYENGNLSKYTPSISPYNTHVYPSAYTPSDVACKIDFGTNRILGEPPVNMIKHMSYNIGCPCIISMHSGETDYTYTIDKNGYIIKVVIIDKACNRGGDESGGPSTSIYNYEIHILN